MPHPAQIRDAVQDYIERQDRPVRSWHIQDEISNRLDTRHALVAQALMQLERDGRVCKHVSPESGAEFWFSLRSETFCGKHSPLPLRGLPWVRVVTGSVPGMFTQSRRSVAS